MRKRIVKKRKRIRRGVFSREYTGDGSVSSSKKREKGGCFALVELGSREIRGLGDESSENGEELRLDVSCEQSEPIPECRRRDNLKMACGFIAVFSVLLATAIACFSFAVAVGANGSDTPPLADSETEADSALGKVIFVRPSDMESGILTAPEIYARCAPSVVSVSVKMFSENGGGEKIGTGFVISEDGYIATAAHVAAGAEELFAVFSDGRRYEAELIAENGASDVALLKIDASELVPLEFGNSGELLAGEKVYSIGTPAALEYSGTFTSGEVSYPDRILPIYSVTGALERKLRLIQTNAELNEGSSGSPLIDEYGRVIGMVTMRLGEGYSGIGFAVPSDGAACILEAMMVGRTLTDEILSGAVLSAPSLGIEGESVAENQIYGFRVTSFADSGSGAAGALRLGDIIVAVDGDAVYREGHTASAINKKLPGDTVSVTVIRSGQRLTFDIILGG